MNSSETFWTLLRDLPHWEFELFLLVLFDGLIGGILWPFLKKWKTHHKGDDQQLLDLQRRVQDLENKLKLLPGLSE
jgi:hypothetical protein